MPALAFGGFCPRSPDSLPGERSRHGLLGSTRMPGTASGQGPDSLQATQKQQGRGGSMSWSLSKERPLPGCSAVGETPGARPAVSAGEQRLCATSERSRRQNPTRRRRILHQPKDSGGAKPFAAAEEPPRTPAAPLLPEISRFFPEFPVFPKRHNPWDPTAPPTLGTGGHWEAAGLSGQWDAPGRDTPANSLFLQECEQEQSGNQTVWGQ